MRERGGGGSPRGVARRDVAPGRPAPHIACRAGPLASVLVDQCLSSTFFGFGGDGTFAYWNAGVAFSASFVAPGR